MIVVADASPLVALALCESLEVLDKLFGTIKVSRSVYEEVTVHDKPKADVLEAYLQEKIVDTNLDALVISGTSLDKGELTSIALYRHLKADYLLIDERAGRKIAKINEIKIIGTLGVLIQSKRQGVISSIKPQIKILRSSQIYFAHNLLDHALKMAGEAEKGTGEGC